MFDDLVLLAKGGLTVYHGPMRNVEEYVAGIGINVPERVNPPDHFADVLEGLVKPNSALLCKIAALRSFSPDKLQYWRESASGISSLAHFLAKDTTDHFNTGVIKPVVFLSMFYLCSNPRSSFTDNSVALLCLVYCMTGMAYILAIFLEPGPSQLLSVHLPVVLTLIATQTRTTETVKRLANLCYTKWTLEAFLIAKAERYDEVQLITRCGALQKDGYNLNNWGLHMSLLILAGIVIES